jgi:uncharacterized protein YkwD
MERARARVALLAIVAALVAVPVATGTATQSHERGTVSTLPGLNAQIVVRINAVRAAHGLPRVRYQPGLGAAARFHNGQMAESGLFQHESPDGTAFWKRVKHFYGETGFNNWSVGETLVWQSPAASAADVVHAWLTSPEHRAILLTPGWREIGVSAVQDTAAPGDFDGLAATIVTADFGVRIR